MKFQTLPHLRKETLHVWLLENIVEGISGNCTRDDILEGIWKVFGLLGGIGKYSGYWKVFGVGNMGDRGIWGRLQG